MKKRLDAVLRLRKLQDQKVRLAEMELVQAQKALADLMDEERALHEQIERTIGASSQIVDLLLRRLDHLARSRSAAQARIDAAFGKVTVEKLRGETANRLGTDLDALVKEKQERMDLTEVIERIGREAGSSFR
jgi:hypothetical protein